MILKKKEFFLLILLIFLPSCSGGKIGNFLESSFNDLEKISQDDDLKKKIENNQVFVQEDKEINDKNYQKSIKVENLEIIQEDNEDRNLEKISQDDDLKKKIENNQVVVQEDKEINDKNYQKRKIELQSYKIILILKDVDPKDPTEVLSTILRNSEVNFEIEKIERILDSKNKSMNKK